MSRSVIKPRRTQIDDQKLLTCPNMRFGPVRFQLTIPPLIKTDPLLWGAAQKNAESETLGIHRPHGRPVGWKVV